MLSLSASLLLFPLPPRLDSLPPDPQEIRTRFCSWSQCASWHSETSGMAPPAARFPPAEGPAPWRQQQLRGKHACCSRARGCGTEQAAWFVLLSPLGSTGSFNAEISDVPLPQTRFPKLGAGGGWWPRGRREFFEEKKHFSPLTVWECLSCGR